MTADAPHDLAAYCTDLGRRARVASRALAIASTATKDRWLHLASQALLARLDEILDANERDLTAATDLGKAQLDRLRLTPERVRAAASGLREVAALPDPIGQVRSGGVRPNGLEVRKVGVPLGV